MRKTNEEKSDGLEIISIGKLYTGPWEKKYWSSSRGKDRYPYPVEFKAVRTQNGITYRMEILEGLKGPLFMISSTDGLSCSGQTPDIAWESFQKKSCSQIKFWHGKRFSCKIDGMELFGFKNAFVQRLLRELVANVVANSTNFLPSGICMDASEAKDSIQPNVTQPFLEKPLATGRRNKKETVIMPASMSMTALKKVRHLNSENSTDDSSCKKRCHSKYNDKCSSMIPARRKENEFINCARATSKQANLEPDIEEQELLVSARDDLHSDSFRNSYHLITDNCFPQEERHSISSENSKTIKEERNLSRDQEFLAPSKVSPGHQLNSLVTEDENEERIFPETIHFNELCAQDTLDHSPEDSCKLKEIIATDTVISEVWAADTQLLREEEIGTSISNDSSENGDLDSIGQEIAKSMMTVLLPRALPLLKTYSRKKKKDVKTSEYSRKKKKDVKTSELSTPTTMTENKNIMAVPSPVRELKKDQDLNQNEYAKISDRNHENYSHVKSVVPDSFDDYDSESLVNIKPHMIPDATVDDQTHVCSETCPSDTFLDAEVQNSGFNTGTNDSKANTYCTTELVLNEYAKISDRNHENYSHVKSVVPDSFDDYDSESLVNIRPHMIPDATVDDQTHVCSETCPSDTFLDAEVQNSGFNTGTNDSKANTYCTTELVLIEYAKISDRNHENYSHVKSVVPDSFDDYDSESLVNIKPHMIPDAAVDDQTHVCSETCPSDTFLDAEVQNSGFNTGTNNSKANTYSTTELVLIEGPQRGEGFMPKSYLGSTSADKEDNFTCFSKNSICVGKELSYGGQDLIDFDMPASYPLSQKPSCSGVMKEKKEVKNSSTVDHNINLNLESGLQDVLKLVVCYIHPLPISAVLLSLAGNDIYICVLCGSPEQEAKILFVYMTPITGEKRGCPFFVGHASVHLPKSEDAFGKMIAVESSAIQFTPDGQSLVLMNNIKVPCCREGNMNCSCPACASDSIDKNAVKIVSVKVGYISVISKLKTAQAVHCILVCDPNYLVAAEDSGKLYLWVMNSRWSAQREECHLPLPDNMPSRLVELKKIPQSPVLIIGHNGHGEFSVWNIEKRILVSRYSAPDTPICKCVPICLFEWQTKGSFPTEYNQEELINKIMDATKMRLSVSDTQLTQSIDNEAGAIWLLISTVSFGEFEDPCRSGRWELNSTECWRLGLLVEDMVIMGSPLDFSATTAGASVDHGVIGTSDGLVYMWELSTGIKVGNLHRFKGSGVSCIATDSSNSGLAIASDGGQLLVYVNPRRASVEV